MYISIHVTMDPVRVVPRAEMTRSPDVAIALGDGPDGLPLVLGVKRSRNVRSAILSVLGSRHSLTSDVNGAIDTLQRVVTRQTLDDGIGTHEGKRGYTSLDTIGAMLGASLFAKAIGEIGPLADGKWDQGAAERCAMTSCGVVMTANEIEQMIGSAGAARRLFVPIPEGHPRVIDVDDEREPKTSRPLLFERLEHIPGARFGYCYGDGEWHSSSFEDPKAYREAVRTAQRISWWLPRHALAHALASLAHKLEDVHGRGRVHGDIKPANLLLASAGPIAIDSLDIEAGRIATVCTPSWAAPEQVTVRPVGAATDVYALGLVLARILDAVVFGEERTFVVPTGGNGKRSMRVLSDPQVFIDPTAGLAFGEGAMRAYAAFIARCTSFDPANRPRSGARFGAELRDLLDRHPLPRDRDAGWCRLGWLAGTLHRTVDLLGAAQPAWVLMDSRRHG
jgi:hypothetical protein